LGGAAGPTRLGQSKRCLRKPLQGRSRRSAGDRRERRSSPSGIDQIGQLVFAETINLVGGRFPASGDPCACRGPSARKLEPPLGLDQPADLLTPGRSSSRTGRAVGWNAAKLEATTLPIAEGGPADTAGSEGGGVAVRGRTQAQGGVGLQTAGRLWPPPATVASISQSQGGAQDRPAPQTRQKAAINASARTANVIND